MGERYPQTLKHKDIAEFEVWRNEKTATERGWLSELVVLPQMSCKGEKGSVRPALSAEEIVALRAATVGCQTSVRTAKANDFRQLLCDDMEFLLFTGGRHRTEAMGVSWQHCEW